MLVAACSAVAALAIAATGAAAQVVVRVETRAMSGVASAFVDRTAVTPYAAAAIKDTTDPLDPAPATTTCAAGSPVAAVIAAVGATQVRTKLDPVTGAWRIASVKGLQEPDVVPPATQPGWVWRLYVDQSSVPDDEACTSSVPEGSEVLLYQACAARTTGCYPGTPLYLRVRDGGPYDVVPQLVPGKGAPVVVRTIADKAPAGATVATDEGVQATSLPTGALPGQTGVSFTAPGPHTIIAYKGDLSRPPARIPVCVTEGNDGYCGSTRVQAPPEIPYTTPSPCDTNGHDGLCGTVDTSGPVTHVTNITNRKAYKARKGPGQVKGTIDADPNGVKDVKLRLTRWVKVKMKVKVKTQHKSRKAKYTYKTVKRCSAWDDGTLLLKTTKKCGTTAGAWFDADLSDLRDAFSYSFALTLPRGTYTLEVRSHDENGSQDAAAAGRNVLTFTVS
jgi:hypothetical protein